MAFYLSDRLSAEGFCMKKIIASSLCLMSFVCYGMQEQNSKKKFFNAVTYGNFKIVQRFIENERSLVNAHDKDHRLALLILGSKQVRPFFAQQCTPCDNECKQILKELEPFIQQSKQEVVEKERKRVLRDGMQQINYWERMKLYRENLVETSEFEEQKHERLRMLLWCAGVGIDNNVREQCLTTWMKEPLADYWQQLLCLCMSAKSVLASDYEPLLEYIKKNEYEMKWHIRFDKKSIVDFTPYENQEYVVERYEQDLLFRKLALEVTSFLMSEKQSLIETFFSPEELKTFKKHFRVLFAGRPFCKEFEVYLEAFVLKDITDVCDQETMLLAMKFRTPAFIPLFKKLRSSKDSESVQKLIKMFDEALREYKIWYKQGALELVNDLVELKLLDEKQ